MSEAETGTPRLDPRLRFAAACDRYTRLQAKKADLLNDIVEIDRQLIETEADLQPYCVPYETRYVSVGRSFDPRVIQFSHNLHRPIIRYFPAPTPYAALVSPAMYPDEPEPFEAFEPHQLPHATPPPPQPDPLDSATFLRDLVQPDDVQLTDAAAIAALDTVSPWIRALDTED